MDEIVPGLWIGNLPSALDTETLKENKIFSVLSAMRGRITVNETFVRHQINLDDTEEEDVLAHFLPSITFIQHELDKGRGVLVHCQAGMSRSATIVAAYLMYTKNMDVESALDMIRQVRPDTAPNEGFLYQLEIFHAASFKISHSSKPTRMYYMARTVEDVMNGDGSGPDTAMFAKWPHTPTDSTPATPGPAPRRRIRCKMCRQELATREHMLDHGQLNPPTPAVFSPAASRRPSQSASEVLSRRPSRGHQGQVRSRLGSNVATPDTRPRRPSGLSMSMNLTMSSSISNDNDNEGEDGTSRKAISNPTSAITTNPPPAGSHLRRSSSGGKSGRHLPFGNLSRNMMESMSMSALDTEDTTDDEESGDPMVASPDSMTSDPMSKMKSGPPSAIPAEFAVEAARSVGRRLSDALIATSQHTDDGKEDDTNTPTKTTSISRTASTDTNVAATGENADAYKVPTQTLASPSDLAAQLFANPKLAALRSPGASMGMTPMTPSGGGGGGVGALPIIANQKCSGYFLEPMKWMEPFLESGQLAGKILCPNKKCGVKLGNYDWAGVCCSCKEWVTPGFCIARSKVDEVA